MLVLLSNSNWTKRIESLYHIYKDSHSERISYEGILMALYVSNKVLNLIWNGRNMNEVSNSEGDEIDAIADESFAKVTLSLSYNKYC